jgi:hypothetical protein
VLHHFPIALNCLIQTGGHLNVPTTTRTHLGSAIARPSGRAPPPRRVHIFRTNANNQVRNARLTALIQPGALKRTGYAELWDMICAQEPLQLA